MILLASLAGASVAQQQEPSFPTLSTEFEVGKAVTQICLDQAPGEVLCGRFRVLEDPSRPDGSTIDLAFVILKALNGKGHSDVVTKFNGGPGVSHTPFAMATAHDMSDIRDTRDILLLDSRGTGNSAGLYCDSPYPRGLKSRFESVFPIDQVQACRDLLTKRTDLSQYTTPRSMDDLADLVLWLGYSKLNLLGTSYGTREAQIFTRRHPELVRTVVMNGVAPVEEPVYIQHARELQRALDNMVEECLSQASCSEAYPHLKDVLETVLKTARDQPPQVVVEGTTVTFGIGPLSYALRGLLYTQSGTIPARLFEARSGNWQALADYYLRRQSWVGRGTGGLVTAGYHYSVLCAEDIGPLSWEVIAEESKGTFMGDFLIAGYKRVCEIWPSAKPSKDFFEPTRSLKPVLLLSGARDAVTPVSGAEAVAENWSNSLHVVVPNGGHGQRGPCIRGLILELIESGSIQGIDSQCVSKPPPTVFERSD